MRYYSWNWVNRGKLYTENYPEGVNRHAKRISLNLNDKVDVFENCRHIGAALEMSIYASAVSHPFASPLGTSHPPASMLAILCHKK